jgi:hypothetical protein
MAGVYDGTINFYTVDVDTFEKDDTLLGKVMDGDKACKLPAFIPFVDGELLEDKIVIGYSPTKMKSLENTLENMSLEEVVPYEDMIDAAKEQIGEYTKEARVKRLEGRSIVKSEDLEDLEDAVPPPDEGGVPHFDMSKHFDKLSGGTGVISFDDRGDFINVCTTMDE